MGVDRFGEMRRLVELFPPQIAVVTNVAPTHLRYLRDEAHIAAEKSELVAALPQNGWAILNADDFRVAAMAERTAANRLWYGIAGAAKHGIDDASRLLQADAIELALDGTRFDLVHNGQRLRAYIPLIGRHHVYTALAAVGVALSLGMPIQQAVDRLQLCERQAGRLNPLSGIRGSIVLDDTYNSSPASAHAALDTLAALPASRRIVVFGDMLELGDAAVRLHQEVGQHAAQVADVIVTKGDLAAEMQLTGQSFSLEQITTNTVAETIAAVRSQLQPGDLVLVKGSAEARMEQVVAGLLASHVNPAQVLVRQ
jgi:UDP-N-acetylmuramyl pentapeptide synthase